MNSSRVERVFSLASLARRLQLFSLREVRVFLGIYLWAWGKYNHNEFIENRDKDQLTSVVSLKQSSNDKDASLMLSVHIKYFILRLHID